MKEPHEEGVAIHSAPSFALVAARFLDLASEKLLLDSLAVLGIETRVIRPRREMISEFGCQACGLFSSWRVNNGGPALRFEQQFAGERSPLRWRHLDDLNCDVG